MAAAAFTAALMQIGFAADATVAIQQNQVTTTNSLIGMTKKDVEAHENRPRRTRSPSNRRSIHGPEEIYNPLLLGKQAVPPWRVDSCGAVHGSHCADLRSPYGARKQR